MPTETNEFPRPLESYPSTADQTLAADLAMRMQVEPFNAVATGVFLLAILHTFATARFAALAHRAQERHDDMERAYGRSPTPRLPATRPYHRVRWVGPSACGRRWRRNTNRVEDSASCRLPEGLLFFGAIGLTAHLGDTLKLAVVQGAVVGGGLTVIANAPNPAGQALLGRFFDDAISSLGLLAGALLPTIVAALVFRLL
jgi:hypothetical protein